MIDPARLSKALGNRANNAAAAARGRWLRLRHALDWTCGPDLHVGPDVDVEIYGTLILGARVRLSRGASLTVGPGATLTLGDDVFIGRHTVIVASRSIALGARCEIAEHVTIRDVDHDLTPEGRDAGTATTTPVTLGERCWIGAGARLLRGTTLGRAVVVGANAVVKGSFPDEVILVGAPARVVRGVREGLAPDVARRPSVNGG